MKYYQSGRRLLRNDIAEYVQINTATKEYYFLKISDITGVLEASRGTYEEVVNYSGKVTSLTCHPVPVDSGIHRINIAIETMTAIDQKTFLLAAGVI